jgi:hypothetical protein
MFIGVGVRLDVGFSGAQARLAEVCGSGLPGQSSSSRARGGGRRNDNIRADAYRSPEAMTAAGSGGRAQFPRTSSPGNQSALRLVGLAALIHMLRSRRFHERVIVGAIALKALARLGQENQASSMERLAAWNQRQVQLLERKGKRHARRLERKGKRQARRLGHRNT